MNLPINILKMAQLPEKNSTGDNLNDYKSKSTKPKSFKKESISKIKRSRQSGIPKQVANRMARRIAITTGLPTISGMGVFVVSYLLVSKGIADIPPALTLLTSAACFLAGLLGLSYGILSASWEDSPGSLLGLEHIGPNIKRMKSAFKKVPTK